MMMMREVADVLHAEWNARDVLFTGVSTDSRTVKMGELFIALKGDKFNGHEFVTEAEERGAVAVIVNQESGAKNKKSGIPLMLVKNTRLALGQLAGHWRQRFAGSLIAVTGSNGKTTVKEMITSILHQTVGEINNVLATEGNLNNDIGVPQTLLRLRKQHVYAVIEMGMSSSSEISYLTKLAKPNIALITNAGLAHVGNFNSTEMVAHAKGEIFEGLDELSGIAVINTDDSYAPLWRKLAGGRQIVDFSLLQAAKVSANYQLNMFDSQMILKLPDGDEKIDLQVPGEHNVRNALAAAAATVAMDIGKKSIASGLGKFTGINGRMQRKQCSHGATLIDDSYNANPDSVRAALAVLARIPGTRILVIGDMGELGRNSENFHSLIGKEARLMGVDKLLALGQLSQHSVLAFGTGAQHFKCIEDLLVAVKSLLAPNVTLLVKGSRFMQMERVVKKCEL